MDPTMSTNDETKAICNLCNALISRGSKFSTSSLLNHIRTKHYFPKKQLNSSYLKAMEDGKVDITNSASSQNLTNPKGEENKSVTKQHPQKSLTNNHNTKNNNLFSSLLVRNGCNNSSGIIGDDKLSINAIKTDVENIQPPPPALVEYNNNNVDINKNEVDINDTVNNIIVNASTNVSNGTYEIRDQQQKINISNMLESNMDITSILNEINAVGQQTSSQKSTTQTGYSASFSPSKKSSDNVGTNQDINIEEFIAKLTNSFGNKAEDGSNSHNDSLAVDENIFANSITTTDVNNVNHSSDAFIPSSSSNYSTNATSGGSSGVSKYPVLAVDDESVSAPSTRAKLTPTVFSDKICLARALQAGDPRLKLVQRGGNVKSPVWKIFRVITFEGRKTNHIACYRCLQVYRYDSHHMGTSNLYRHKCVNNTNNEKAVNSVDNLTQSPLSMSPEKTVTKNVDTSEPQSNDDTIGEEKQYVDDSKNSENLTIKDEQSENDSDDYKPYVTSKSQHEKQQASQVSTTPVQSTNRRKRSIISALAQRKRLKLPKLQSSLQKHVPNPYPTNLVNNSSETATDEMDEAIIENNLNTSDSNNSYKFWQKITCLGLMKDFMDEIKSNLDTCEQTIAASIKQTNIENNSIDDNTVSCCRKLNVIVNALGLNQSLKLLFKKYRRSVLLEQEKNRKELLDLRQKLLLKQHKSENLKIRDAFFKELMVEHDQILAPNSVNVSNSLTNNCALSPDLLSLQALIGDTNMNAQSNSLVYNANNNVNFALNTTINNNGNSLLTDKNLNMLYNSYYKTSMYSQANTGSTSSFMSTKTLNDILKSFDRTNPRKSQTSNLDSMILAKQLNNWNDVSGSKNKFENLKIFNSSLTNREQSQDKNKIVSHNLLNEDLLDISRAFFPDASLFSSANNKKQAQQNQNTLTNESFTAQPTLTVASNTSEILNALIGGANYANLNLNLKNNIDSNRNNMLTQQSVGNNPNLTTNIYDTLKSLNLPNNINNGNNNIIKSTSYYDSLLNSTALTLLSQFNLSNTNSNAGSTLKSYISFGGTSENDKSNYSNYTLTNTNVANIMAKPNNLLPSLQNTNLTTKDSLLENLLNNTNINQAMLPNNLNNHVNTLNNSNNMNLTTNGTINENEKNNHLNANFEQNSKDFASNYTTPTKIDPTTLTLNTVNGVSNGSSSPLDSNVNDKNLILLKSLRNILSPKTSAPSSIITQYINTSANESIETTGKAITNNDTASISL